MSENAQELLKRYRDTYLKNNAQEKIFIEAALQQDSPVPNAQAPKEKKKKAK